MVLDSKFVFIALVVLAAEMDVSVSSSDLKVKQFLAQVRPVLTDPFLLFLLHFQGYAGCSCAC